MASEFSPELQNQLIQQISSDIIKDGERIDLKQCLNLTAHTNPTMSGSQYYDYPVLSNSVTDVTRPHIPGSNLSQSLTLKQLSLVKNVPIPADILSEFPRMQAHCVSGFFPLISRAWIAIDNTLYIWNYLDGSDPTFFDGVSETILTALVAKPKSIKINNAVFQNVLVICTASEIIILGLNLKVVDELSNESHMKTELVLHTEPLFRISTDSCIFTCSVNTKLGRIFLGGSDGALHEVDYKPSAGWFSGTKCWKNNHSKSTLSYVVPLVSPFLSASADEALVQLEVDEGRNLLFARTDKGALRLFDLGASGNELYRTAAMSIQTIQNNASAITRSVDRSNFKIISHIAVIHRNESEHLNLLMTTSTGARLYFTVKGFNYSHDTRPYMLALVHVRLPPGFTSSSRDKPSNVGRTVHVRGTTLMCCCSDGDNETLWCISNDSFGPQVPLKESYTRVDLDQLTWDMIKLNQNQQVLAPRCSSLVEQFFESRQQFAMLNATSTLLVEKLRPVDQLRELLLENSGPDNEQVQMFFSSLFKPAEACVMALLLAADDSSTFVHVANWAIQAMILYGNEPKFSGIRNNPTSLEQNVSGVQDFTFNPRFVSTSTKVSTSPNNMTHTLGSFIYSDKFLGTCLFVSRVLRFTWEFPLLKETLILNSKVPALQFRWTKPQILEVLRRLRYLNSLFPKLFDPSVHSSAAAQRVSQFQVSAEALKIELDAVDHLRLICTKSEELLAFLSILMDYNVEEMLAGLSGPLKQQLRDLKFRDFISTDKTDVTSLLCVTVFGRLISENVKTDPLINKLREICPTVFSADDAICVQANDLLQNGLKAPNPDSQDHFLYESLELFKQVANVVDLVQVCGYYQQVNFCEGIVDLCLCAAAKRDPKNLGLIYYRNMQPVDDLIGRQLFNTCQECYQCILKMVHYYHSVIENGGSVASESSVVPGNLTAHEARSFFDGVISECLAKDDELLHYAVFHWLLNRGLYDTILENANVSLEYVLTSQCRTSSDRELIVLLELLWKFYEKNGQYEQAAQILCSLAGRRSTFVNLGQRVNYLGRALVSAKSSSPKVMNPEVSPELIKEIEDQLEVAQVQVKVVNAVRAAKTILSGDKEDVISLLNSELFNLTSLYSDFACSYSLAECKLACIVVAGHNDPTKIQFIWTELIDNLFKDFISERSKDPQSTGTSVEALSSRFSAIAKDYVEKNEQYLPLNTIINHMEKRSCELKLGVSWIFLLLLQLGLEHSVLMLVYTELWSNKEKIWKMLGEPYHLLSVIDALIRHFLDTAMASGDQKLTSSGRSTFFEVMSPFVSKELVKLTSMSSSDPACKTLIDSLKKSLHNAERLAMS
ncbi:nuclear pore complex protein Nup155-like [Symsagittifera roscoffensis]|uniref:nuclear pore complex protein Nup155-like n=1 Tax=Symsagittifera roscoffensis TaxID=84072 RepID=UPI00307B5100